MELRWFLKGKRVFDPEWSAVCIAMHDKIKEERHSYVGSYGHVLVLELSDTDIITSKFISKVLSL